MSEASSSPIPSEEPSQGSTGELFLLLSIEDAGKALSVGRSTIYQLISEGDLEVVHIGRAARVPDESVQGFVRRLRAS